MKTPVTFEMISCKPDSLQAMIRRHVSFRISLLKREASLYAFISVFGNDDPARIIDAVGIKAKACDPSVLPIQTGHDVFIQREVYKERPISHQNHFTYGCELDYPAMRQGRSKHVIPLTCIPSFELTLHGMHAGDYVSFSFNPVTPVRSNPQLDDESNGLFLQSPCCFTYSICASSAIAGLLVYDLNESQSRFRISDISEDTLAHTDIAEELFTLSDVTILCQGLDNLLSSTSTFTPDIDAYMSPAYSRAVKPDIAIGRVTGFDVGLLYTDLTRNVSVTGVTGSGKTRLLTSMITQLHAAGIATVVIAPVKRDFSKSFIPNPNATLYRAGSTEYPLRFNLLDVPSPRVATEAISGTVSLGGDESVLPVVFDNSCCGLLASGKEKSIFQLAGFVKKELLSSGYSRENSRNLTQAALNRLKTLQSTAEFDCSRSNLRMDAIFEPGTITILELNDMDNKLRRDFAGVLLARLRAEYLARRPLANESDKPRLVIVIDELHELLQNVPADPCREILNASLNICRGLNVGYILADQRAELLAEIAQQACSSHIVLRGPSTPAVADMLNVPFDSPMLSQLHRLKPGECLFSLSGQDTLCCSAMPLSSDTEAAQEPSSQDKPDYCPYDACTEVCQSCNFKLCSCCEEAVTGELYGDAYQAYKHSMQEYANAVANQRDQDRSEPDKDIFIKAGSQLLRSCRVAAITKLRQAGIDVSDDNSAVIEHCLKCAIKRQLAVRI